MTLLVVSNGGLGSDAATTNRTKLERWILDEADGGNATSSDGGEVNRGQTAVCLDDENSCDPMTDWQMTFHVITRVCGALSLVPREQRGILAERMEGPPVRRRACRAAPPSLLSGSVVLKSLKYVHDPDEETFELGRIDAVLLDVLTGSPHRIDVLGHCGTTSIQE